MFEECIVLHSYICVKWSSLGALTNIFLSCHFCVLVLEIAIFSLSEIYYTAITHLSITLSTGKMSAYENVVGGKLKLKGKALDVKAGGMKKKKKQKKHQDQLSLVTENELPAGRFKVGF